jgi:hypothetical protein
MIRFIWPQFFKHLADFRTRASLVDKTGKCRHLLGPRPGAARRHHRLLVPFDQPECPVKISDLSEFELQLIVRRFNHSLFPSTLDVNRHRLQERRFPVFNPDQIGASR